MTSWLPFILTVAACIISSWPAEGDLISFAAPLVLLLFPPDGDTFISDVPSLLTASGLVFCVRMEIPFSSPRLLFGINLDTGSCRSGVVAGECLPSLVPLAPSPSESVPEAELLSDWECDRDFLSCFSSFFFFFFFFLAMCLLCFLDFPSPSVSTRPVITSLLPSSFNPSWSPAPEAAASLALARVVLTGLVGGDGSTSDSAPDSELLSFSPFLLFFFFLLLCFLCFLLFLWGVSFPSLAFKSSFSSPSSSPEGMSTALSIMPAPQSLSS